MKTTLQQLSVVVDSIPVERAVETAGEELLLEVLVQTEATGGETSTLEETASARRVTQGQEIGTSVNIVPEEPNRREADQADGANGRFWEPQVIVQVADLPPPPPPPPGPGHIWVEALRGAAEFWREEEEEVQVIATISTSRESPGNNLGSSFRPEEDPRGEHGGNFRPCNFRRSRPAAAGRDGHVRNWGRGFGFQGEPDYINYAPILNPLTYFVEPQTAAGRAVYELMAAMGLMIESPAAADRQDRVLWRCTQTDPASQERRRASEDNGYGGSRRPSTQDEEDTQ